MMNIRSYAVDICDCNMIEANRIKELLVDLGEHVFEKTTFGKYTNDYSKRYQYFAYLADAWGRIAHTSDGTTVVSGKKFIEILNKALQESHVECEEGHSVVWTEVKTFGEWLEAMVNGAIGRQSCNTNITYYYDEGLNAFMYKENGNKFKSKLRYIQSPRTYWIATKMPVRKMTEKGMMEEFGYKIELVPEI